MTDLKPCRFCGIVPHAWLDDYINGRAVTDPEYIIECENGNCSVMPEVRGTYPYMDEVRTMWNTANTAGIREAALQEAVVAVNAKWRSGAVDTHDELRGLALAEAAILDLIDNHAVQPDTAAIRIATLQEVEKALRKWQDNLILCGYKEAPITVGMAADLVATLKGVTT